MKNIRLLIAEDHNLVRQGLVNMIEQAKDICIVAEADDGQTLVDKYIELQPDIVLTDISMPKLNGIQAAEKIIEINKKAKIIFLSILCDDKYISKAVSIGASGLVSKSAVKNELTFAIYKVINGGLYFTGKTDDEINAIINKNEETIRISNYNLLTAAEKDILHYIGQGYTSDEISQITAIGKRAVDKYRLSIMEKLDLKSLPQLIKYAVEANFYRK